MNRDVEMELSLWEMLLSVKRYWYLVLIVAVVCTAAGGGFGYIRITRQQNAVVVEDTEASDEHKDFIQEFYDGNQEMLDEVYQTLVPQLRAQWTWLKELSGTHPLMKLDPANCTSERLTLCFDPDSGAHDRAVFDWLQSADESKLFGSSTELAGYKNDLIIIGEGSYMTGGSRDSSFLTREREQSDTAVTIINVDGFDAAAAANYLKTYLRTKATASGMKLIDITSSQVSGYNSLVMDFQNMITERINTVCVKLNNMYDNSVKKVDPPSFDEPASAAPEGVTISGLMKYALVGFALGLILGALLAIFLTLKKGCIVSRRQVEDSFGLELLGDCSKNGPAAIEVLNSNLDIMVGNAAEVMVLGSCAEEDVTGTVDKWNSVAGADAGRFIAGRDIVDDSATIDALNNVEGIVLGVRVGESRLADIQRLMLRAHKLDKRVLGYVQL